MSGSDQENGTASEGDGEVEAEKEAVKLKPHPIATRISRALKTVVCGDFATFGVAALPFPGLSIHHHSITSSSGSASTSTSIRTLARPNGAFQVALPLTLAQAVDQLKARCSLVADGAAHVWEMSAVQFKIENPAFHAAVSAADTCQILIACYSGVCVDRCHLW
jgi:hypothetical protein